MRRAAAIAIFVGGIPLLSGCTSGRTLADSSGSPAPSVAPVPGPDPIPGPRVVVDGRQVCLPSADDPRLSASDRDLGPIPRIFIDGVEIDTAGLEECGIAPGA